MIRDIFRRYQDVPQRAACHKPGCSWRRDGDDAEDFARVHFNETGHVVVVVPPYSVLILTPAAPVARRRVMAGGIG